MTYLFLTEVKCLAPSGYKPRTRTYKSFSLSENRKDLEKIEQKAINIISESLTEQNPSVDLKFTAKTTVINDVFWVNSED